MKKTLSIILALCLILALTACGLLKDEGSYSIGDDKITSIGGVIGELGARKVNGIEKAIKDGVTTHTYEYKTDPDDPEQAANDLVEYFKYLQENDGFISTIAFSGLPYGGGQEIQLAKHSVDEGKIIILDIEYNDKGYTLTFTKAKGTLDEN
jgi:hypothetical protein